MSNQALAEIQHRAQLISENSIKQLGLDSKALYARHSASGLLRSGNTFKAIFDLTINSMQSYLLAVEEFSKSVTPNNISSFSADVVKSIEGSTEILLNAIQAHLCESAKLAGKESLAERFKEEHSKEIANVFAIFQSNLRNHSQNLSDASSFSSRDRIFFIVELFLLLISTMIVGMWINDPSGPYEPWLSLFGLPIPVLETVRRLWKK